MAKPFLKWAGGKTQLLNTYSNMYPVEYIKQRKINKYMEPFVGSGAVLFYLINNFSFESIVINDANPELITVYKVVKSKNIESLIRELKKLENEFLPLEKEKRKDFFYKIRDEFNKEITDYNESDIYHENNYKRAAYFIFLNKTCFNGLYRVNKKGLFNVPFGDYKKPKICDEENLYAVHEGLQNVKITLGDFTQTKIYADERTFVYMDPPYRPISATSNFTSYSKNSFDDEEQVKLANYYKELDKKNSYLMLSNSDPKNNNPDDDFFDKLYNEFNIYRVDARRSINSKANGRGAIKELVITNY